MNLKVLFSKNGLPYTYAIFYAVGFILYALPPSRPLFIVLTPYTLLLTALSAFIHHKDWSLKSISILLFIFAASILLEAIGVASGKLFGIYNYSTEMGIAVRDVPLIIGVNWVILVYASNAIVSKYSGNSLFRISTGSVLMVLYDIVLEKVAPVMNMWEFENGSPPIRNYVMWFLMAILFQTIFVLFRVDSDNKPARALFIAQVVLFISIIIFNQL